MKKQFILSLISLIVLAASSVAQETWQKIHEITGEEVFDFEVLDTTVLLGTSDGTYFLSNDLSSLYERSNGLIDKYISDVDDFNGTLLAGTWDGLHLSYDNGLNWTDKSGTGFASKNIRSIAVNDSVIVVGVNGGEYISSDTCKTWNDFHIESTYNVRDMLFNNSMLLASSDAGVFVSDDTFKSWEKISGNGATRDIVIFENKIIIAGDFGVFSSIDTGTTWETHNNGLLDSSIVCIATDNNYIYVGTSSEGIYYSKDLTKWNSYNDNLLDKEIVSISILGDSLILCGTANGSIFRRSLFKEQSTGIFENEFKESITVYPNPTNGNLTINLGKSQEKVTLRVRSITGELISKSDFLSTNTIKYRINGINGIYIIELSNKDGNLAILKVLKN